MENELKNKVYTLYDWMIVIIGFLLVAVFCLAFRSCETKPALTELKPIKEEINAQIAQKAYDRLLVISARQMDSLENILAESKKKDSKIIIRYKTLHDTIFLTPADKQLDITKTLCPGTGDSVNLQEINYCLASGKQSEELYKNSLTAIGALKGEVKVQTNLVVEGQKNMASKDSLNIAYKEINTKLDKKAKKEERRKKVWRNISIGAVTVIVVQILLSIF